MSTGGFLRQIIDANYIIKIRQSLLKLFSLFGYQIETYDRCHLSYLGVKIGLQLKNCIASVNNLEVLQCLIAFSQIGCAFVWLTFILLAAHF